MSGIKRNSVQNSLTAAQEEAEYAGIDKTRAETDNILLKNKWQEVENEFQRAYKAIGLEETASRISNLNASAAKLFSDVDVNNSVIEVNGHRIQLISSEISSNTDDGDNAGLYVNIPCNVYIEDTVISGDRQGMFVRQGIVTLKNVTIEYGENINNFA